MKDEDKIIYDLLKEVREDQKQNSKKITKTAECVKNIQKDLEEVKEETKENTKHMGQHMRRTDGVEKTVEILTDLHADNQKRIEQLEKEDKKKEKVLLGIQAKKEAASWLKSNIKWFLGAAVALATLGTKIAGLW